MKFIKMILLLAPVLTAIPLSAQSFCNLFDGEVLSNITGVNGIEEYKVQTIVYDIMSAHHIANNILVFPDKNIDNVKAGVKKIDGSEHRVIYYNPSFINGLETTFNKWCIYSAFAHEVGHCVNADFLNGGVSTREKEIEADKFSGASLCLLGAPSFGDAISYMEQLAGIDGSHSHPPKRERVMALTAGWNSTKQLRSKMEDVNSLSSLYDERIKEAETFFAQKDYVRAELKFQDAVVLKPAEVYPQGMLSQINKIKEEYKDLIGQATSAKERYNDELAIKKTAQANELMPYEQLPQDLSELQNVVSIQIRNEPLSGCGLLFSSVDISINMNGRLIRYASEWPDEIKKFVVPKGKYTYKVDGTFECRSSPRCNVKGSGTIEVYEGSIFELVWKNKKSCEMMLND